MNNEFNNENINQIQNNNLNNQYEVINEVVGDNVNKNNNSNDKLNKVLIAIIGIILSSLIALTIYAVLDKKEDNIDNDIKENENKNLNYKIVKDNNNVNLKRLYVNNIEVLAGIDMKVEEFNYNNIIVTMSLDAENKIYFVNSLGEVIDLNFFNSTKKNIKYHHSYYISGNSIVVLAEPGLEYQSFKKDYCSLYASDSYYSSSNLTRNEVLESIAYKIKYEYIDGKLDNKEVIEEKSIKEGFSIETCKSKLNFISYTEGHICINHNNNIVCFNDLKKNKEKLENIFGRENCYVEKEKYICKIDDAFDYNGNGMEAHLNLNTNIVSDYIYKGRHCYESRICQNEI